LNHRVSPRLKLLPKNVQSVRTPGSKIGDSRPHARRMQKEPHRIYRSAQEFRRTPFIELGQRGIS
jgi:hypothetical protein